MPRFLIHETLKFGPSVYVKEKIQKRFSELILINASLGNNNVYAYAHTQLSTSLVFFISTIRKLKSSKKDLGLS